MSTFSFHTKELPSPIVEKRQPVEPGQASAVPSTSVSEQSEYEIPYEAVLQTALEKELNDCSFITGAAIALLGVDGMCCRARIGAKVPPIGTRIDPEAGLTGLCVRTGQVQICNDVDNDPRVDVEACRSLGLRSLLVFPLKRNATVLGVIELVSDNVNAFDEALLAKPCRLGDSVLSPSLEEGSAKFVPIQEAPVATGTTAMDLQEVVSECFVMEEARPTHER